MSWESLVSWESPLFFLETPITSHIGKVFTEFPPFEKQPDRIPHRPSFDRLSWALGWASSRPPSLRAARGSLMSSRNPRPPCGHSWAPYRCRIREQDLLGRNRHGSRFQGQQHRATGIIAWMKDWPLNGRPRPLLGADSGIDPHGLKPFNAGFCTRRGLSYGCCGSSTEVLGTCRIS